MSARNGPHALPDAGQSILASISNEMVRVYKDQFGRGPTRARTHWCGEDIVITVLENTLTPPERRLVELGEHERLRDSRTFFQYTAINEFCSPIERLTGRRVRAFISGIDTEVDGLSTETFILYARSENGGRSRAEAAAF
jgi:uncharacterized protein YbcI